jgi:hypothetical protein
MNYNAEINRKKVRLEKLITDGLRNKIQELNLIDTGEMLDTTQCIIMFTKEGFDIDIQSTEYFIYNDDKYQLLDSVLINREINDLIDEIYLDIIEFNL